ncbi:HNH endonuclease [Emticicia agri]|uniref:HNH endonuclease n=1 Tax=Emticicia agri TaxID=2492393 RepID=A0A4Q5LXS0_9BACT|nr:HNH endonuclease [Emticicia agri]RYU94666.1 HNH endonuclease [Emticicia agri]
MIKLKDLSCPPELTEEVAQALTDEFKTTGNSVWKKDYIAEQLMTMSNGKCCFSECKLSEEGKYAEVEHFHPKSLYPDEVVKWENLLPINNAVNKAKSAHDTKLEPIINPRFDNPKKHLAFKTFRFKGKDEIGRKTIEVLNLNDTRLWVDKRYEIGNEAVETLEDISQELQEYDRLEVKTTRKRNNILRKLRNLFYEGTPEAEYSAVVASYLLNDDDYIIIREILVKYSLWDEEFEKLEKQLEFCALDVIS